MSLKSLACIQNDEYDPIVAAKSVTRFGDLIGSRRNGADGAFFVPVASCPLLWRACRAAFGLAGLPWSPARQTCTSATL